MTKKKENIINNEENIKEIKNNNTIMFIFNITFEDFIDIYTYKKSIDDLLGDYKINKNDIDCLKITKNIIGINQIFREIIKKNDLNYFLFFIFYLYNYKRWFHLKKSR